MYVYTRYHILFFNMTTTRFIAIFNTHRFFKVCFYIIISILRKTESVFMDSLYLGTNHERINSPTQNCNIFPYYIIDNICSPAHLRSKARVLYLTTQLHVSIGQTFSLLRTRYFTSSRKHVIHKSSTSKRDFAIISQSAHITPYPRLRQNRRTTDIIDQRGFNKT